MPLAPSGMKTLEERMDTDRLWGHRSTTLHSRPYPARSQPRKEEEQSRKPPDGGLRDHDKVIHPRQ